MGKRAQRRRAAKKRGRPRRVRMTEDVAAGLQEQLAKFRAKFGRDPGPHDPVFFDPDADEPRPLDLDKADEAMLEAMRAAGIRPALIHATMKTGMLMTTDNQDEFSDEEIAAWQDAIAEYEELQRCGTSN